MDKEPFNFNNEELAIKHELASLRIRMTGMTTRIIDSYVQELYKNRNEWITIHDHFPSHNADRMVLEKILRRMAYEHPNDKLDIDKLNNRLKLVSCESDSKWKRMDELNRTLYESK